ncbi:MAG: four-carbon acid sugar kinase family protein [Acidobacteriota bacterium]
MGMRIGIVADDLTGAADTAVAFLEARMPVSVRFARPDLEMELARIGSGAVAIDAGTRGVGVESAGLLALAAAGAFKRAGFDVLYKKIDSLLRGHVAAEVRATMTAWGPGSVAIVAPAFPAVGRTTVDGRAVIAGHPHAGASVVDLFAGSARVQPIGLDGVRSPTFAQRLGDVASADGVIVCDAESDADLRSIARAGLVARRPTVWVGSAGLAHALAGELRLTPPLARPRPPRVHGPILAVVGSLTSIAQAQARRLVTEGVTHVRVSPGELMGMALPLRVDAALGRFEDVLVTIDAPSPIEGEGDAQLVALLGAALAPSVVRHAGGLVLTGGDTAAGLLRALGCTGLDLAAEIEPGVVLSTSAGLRECPVITKSGSFGDASTLASAVRYLRGLRE